MMIRLPAAVAVCLTLASPAAALEPGEMLDDPVLEARAQALGKELRCVVCQNESIHESNAGLAKDLRVLLRERLTAGDRDEEAVDYIVERYGDYVLLNPPFKEKTLVLWIGPGVLALFALLGGFLILRRARPVAAPTTGALTEDEAKRVEALLDEQKHR